jgi:hypothetical protein
MTHMQSAEQYIMSSDDLQALREYIEQHLPWLVILGVVGEQPLLAVKDTAHLNLCVGFRSQADLAAYLALVRGKGCSHVQ